MKKLLDLEIDYDNICNLKCTYCILNIKKQDNHNKVILDNIITYVVKYIRVNDYDSVRLRLSSCEPMLVINDMLRLVQILSSMNLYIELNIVTNATIVDSLLLTIRSLVNKVNLSISIDEVFKEFQSERLFKNGDRLSTELVLSNAALIEELLDTKAIYSSVVIHQSKDDIANQISFFRDRNRINLLQFDANITTDHNDSRFDLVEKYKEHDCSLDCLRNKNRMCVDFNGDVYICRSQKTIGLAPIRNISDNNFTPLDYDFDKIIGIIENSDYKPGKCPLIYYNNIINRGDASE